MLQDTKERKVKRCN